MNSTPNKLVTIAAIAGAAALANAASGLAALVLIIDLVVALLLVKVNVG